MRLAAMYNTWGDVDLLELSIKNIRPMVEMVIVIISRTSNFGEKLPLDEPDGSAFKFPDGCPIFFKQREPDLKKSPRENETAKRNYGLHFAREMGATHFVAMDADEFYDPDEFKDAKECIQNPDFIKGFVVKCQTYFRSPTLTIGYDITLVPFIHELTPTIKHTFNRSYPYAWQGPQIRIDPTRSLNINSGVQLTDFTMHHFSWIRSDFKRKIRNSTAKDNLERSTIWEDLVLAKDGYFVKFYQKHLTTVPNRFNIPDYGDLDKDLQQHSTKFMATANPKHKPS